MLCAEILAIKIRGKSEIVGIPIHEINNILGQYADDMDTYMMAKNSCISALFETIEDFGRHTGFKINYDKTTVYRIGSLENTEAIRYSKKALKWTNEPINILGVVVHRNEELAIKLNYDPLVKKD